MDLPVIRHTTTREQGSWEAAEHAPLALIHRVRRTSRGGTATYAPTTLVMVGDRVRAFDRFPRARGAGAGRPCD